MRVFVVLSAFFLLGTGTVFGQLTQAGYIGLYADPAGTDCTLDDLYPGVATVYVVHHGTLGANGSQFRVIQSFGANLMFLGDIIPGLHIAIGNSQTGIAVGYLGCLPSPIGVMQIQYFTQGLSAPCSMLEVVPDPAAVPLDILVADCVGGIWIGGGKGMYVNAGPKCEDCDTIPIPSQPQTWGSLKSLYR